MHEIKMPQLGQSVEEASIVKWFKQEGDPVEKGEPLFAIQTDKAEIECESTAGGVLRKILLEPDVSVPVLTVVAFVGTPDEPLPAAAASRAPSPESSQTQTAALPEAVAPERASSSPVAAIIAGSPAGAHAPVSPRAKAAAHRLHVSPDLVTGTGVGGRVVEADVRAYAESHESIRVTPTARRVAENEGIELSGLTGSGPRGKITKADLKYAPTAPAVATSPAGTVRRVPLSGMRKVIAKRMAESKFSAPHYYVTVEVDMAACVRYRNSLGAFKPSYNDLVVRAVAVAIQQWPAVNARWAGDAIEEVADINLGVAVALPSGLIVPVLRRVQDKSLQQINAETRDLAEKARTGKLLPDDYSGNTFTISNLGAYGVDQFTAIINQPDSAILAVGQIKDRPVVIDGGIHIRPIAKMTLSSDHRVIDGAVAAQFMGCLKEKLELAAF
ncbi:MAG: 2-oxo acid dehydrogenase subunit E2 [Candidatus Hydrogenedentes bacterium]|nr:2-oxo acid dehydrogenase subunit E2 [Candidatus Hydrogenedentota bacterium]